MQKNTDILNELTLLSPLVAAISKVNVFTVPRGYFTTVSDTVLACIREECEGYNPQANTQSTGVPEGYFDQLATSILNKIKQGETAADETRNLSPMLGVIQRENVFEAPDGYFENLGKCVFDKINARATDVELSTLMLSLQNKNVFEAPEEYFENLGNNVVDKINARATDDELSTLMFSLQSKNVFEAPDGYFENLGNNVVDKINARATDDELSPLLINLQSKNVFEAPEGYFEKLSGNILNKARPSTARVVSIWNRSSFLKYAAAAMMTGVIATGIYKYADQHEPGAINIENNNSLATLDSTIEKGKDMNDAQFNETLATLNDADIAKYLETNGDIADVAVLRNNMDGSNLPSQDDYLLDETTLHDYIQEIDKTTLNN